MTYLLEKYKNIIVLTLLLTAIFTILYTFKNKNINAIPEKADLVFANLSSGDCIK